MHTINAPEFDYYTYMRQNSPDFSKIQGGLAARQHRRETATGSVPVGI